MRNISGAASYRSCGKKGHNNGGYPVVKRKCDASYMMKHEDQEINAVLDDVVPMIVVCNVDLM
jgi:hypothetical protein